MKVSQKYTLCQGWFVLLIPVWLVNWFHLPVLLSKSCQNCIPFRLNVWSCWSFMQVSVAQRLNQRTMKRTLMYYCLFVLPKLNLHISWCHSFCDVILWRQSMSLCDVSKSKHMKHVFVHWPNVHEFPAHFERISELHHNVMFVIAVCILFRQSVHSTKWRQFSIRLSCY